MESNIAGNTAGFLSDPSSSHSMYAYVDENIIDLGLSLKMLNAQNNNPSHLSRTVAGGYDIFSRMEAPNLVKPDMAYHDTRSKREDANEEEEGVQSKERYAYLKVNMDGVLVGRKICIPDHSSYASLALTLEDMFGWQSFSGLHLFQEGSNYALYYKDREGNWRSAGDVPWKAFMESVRRLRIVNVTFDDAGNS